MIGSFLVDTDDLGEAEAKLCENYGAMRICAKPDGASTRTRVWRVASGSLTLDEVEYGYDFDFTMAPLESILLCRMRSGVIEERGAGREPVVHGPGTVAAFGAHEGMEVHGTVRRAHYDLMVVDRAWLNDVAAPVTAASGSRAYVTHLTSSTPQSPAAAKVVTDAIDYIRHGVLANTHAALDPLLAGAATRYLAAATLSAFAHTVSEQPTEPIAGASVLVGRAVAFIDENAHVDISPADIAASANLTPEVMQMMFVKHRGCTPMQYVRRVRMDHAHRDLLAADPANCSVADIARRWGFGNLSRFAVAYRMAYGRSPRSALRS